MNNQILADYYEEKGFINKAKRLRRNKPLVIFGWYKQEVLRLGFKDEQTYS